MRALAKYLFVFLWAAAPSLGDTTDGDLFDFEPPAPSTEVVPQGSVQQVQFDDLVPLVPDAKAEADVTGGDALALPQPDELPSLEEEPAAASVLDMEAMTENHQFDMPITDVFEGVGAEVYSTNDWFRGGQWYSKQQLVMLLRTKISLVHMAVDATEAVASNRLIPSPFLNASLATTDAGFTYEAGTRLTLGKILGRDVANRDHGIEFSFLGLFEYTGRASLTPNDPTLGGIISLVGSQEVNSVVDGLVLGFPIINRLVGFDNSLVQDLTYEAELNSFELNYLVGARPNRDRLVLQPDGRWVRHATPSLVTSVYTGLRYVRQNERLTYTGQGGRNRFQDATGQITFLEPVPAGGVYRVDTDNDLVGIQIGGEAVRKRTNWVLGINGRVGGLINFADRNSHLVQTFDSDLGVGVNMTTDVTEERLNDETLTFLAETSAYVSYYVRPNTAFRFGYNALFMNGLAIASDNIGLAGGFANFELTGNAIYHGMDFGLEMTW